MPSAGIRPYVVYGPGRDQGMTSGPTLAMEAAARSERFAIAYGGSAQYDYAPDVGRAFARAAGCSAGAVVANFPGVRATMRDVVHAIEAAAPAAAGMITWEDSTSLPFPAELESGALEEVLGAVTATPLAAGIAETVARFRGS